MTATANRRRVVMPNGIRKKFVAALAMLLVAAIMLVSSTYAWFTLSTAPEVTGITTNVGANGNLEIALLGYNNFTSGASDLGVATNVGDSMDGVKPITEANGTWGNLVDLSPTSYGLSSIVLAPAALNVATSDSKTVGSSILMAPTYGSDGRVITVSEPTVTGKLDGSAFAVDETYRGVRAIGVSSGITLRMSTYSNAIAGISVNMSNARSAARAALVDNGQNLGGLLMKVASASDPTTVTFTREEVEYFEPVLAGLESANAYILTAIKNAALANAVSAANGAELTDEQVAALAAAINAATPETLATAAGGSLPAKVSAALTQYNTTASELSDAGDAYSGLTTGANESKTEYSYNDVEDLLESLINKQNVSVAGVNNPGRDDISALADAAMTGDPVAIVMKPGSGIFVDLAQNAGDYTAGPIRVPVSYSGLNMNLTVNMSTQAGDPILLTEAQGEAQEAGQPSSGEGATAIDDTYGYALDFGFRTNAAGSNLLLQQDARQRVYSGNNASESELTQGGGSYVRFISTNTNTFSVNEMKALMSAMRVVFAEPTTTDGVTSYEILAIAAPDITATTDQSTGITTYEGGEAVGTDGWKVKLALYNYTVAASSVQGDAPILTLGEKKTGEGANAIVALEQNVGKKITVIVYLDGDLVDNTMVANAVTSMSGALNLQFASDVDLVPMENTKLRAGTGTPGSPSIPETVTKEQLNTAISSVKGSSVYTAASGADEPTDAQTALLTRVTEAEDVAADDEATPAQIKTAATNLAMAYIAAGGTTNPIG